MRNGIVVKFDLPANPTLGQEFAIPLPPGVVPDDLERHGLIFVQRQCRECTQIWDAWVFKAVACGQIRDVIGMCDGCMDDAEADLRRRTGRAPKQLATQPRLCDLPVPRETPDDI